MTIAEKVKQSAYTETFTLYIEGMFYKCYNEDAMVFSQHVKKYQVSVKHVKSAGSVVLSLGFPESEVARGRLTFEHISEALGADGYSAEEKQVVFRLKENVKKNFADWCKAYAVSVKTHPNGVSASLSAEKINALLTVILHFDLANTTPMQGLQFIQELKQKVREIPPVTETNGNF